MLSAILRWGGKRPEQPDPSAAAAAKGGDALVPSKALPKFLAAISHQSETPVLVDLGPVIGANVSFFGEQLGCKLFIEDLFADYERHAKAGTLEELAGAMEKRFRHEDGTVDGILCWDIFDYLPKAASQALAGQIVRMLKPGGSVMGFFCSSAPPGKTPFTKYEIADEKSLRHRQHAGGGGAKHVLLNRDIIRMFEGLVVSESFLLKSNTREILLKRRS
jgi:hypothetical protein